ncbi:MAG: 4Fe-4S dicluster domain-containing protein [Frankia sp.]|nr:4Fe-4S dicluster domain-containing protein [Frankia sp.]
MTAAVSAPNGVASCVIPPAGLDVLIRALRARGYRVVGPTVRNRAIVYEELTAAAQLPVGWTDVQDGATYRLERRDDDARFGYAVGPHSWKQFLLPPRLRLLRVRRTPGGGADAGQDGGDGARGGGTEDDGGYAGKNGGYDGSSGGTATAGPGPGRLDFEEEPPPTTRLALIGVRSCELHAIAIQDRILVAGRYPDRDYTARREGLFIVALNCHEPGGTCFCVSMDTGPAVRQGSGYDLVLSEILTGEHRFLVEAGTGRGAEVLAELTGPPAANTGVTTGSTGADDRTAAGGANSRSGDEPAPARPATSADWEAAQTGVERAVSRMGRTLDADNLRDLLAANLEHPRWDDVASRCLTCGNCTMVCPTCFCLTVEDVGDLAGGEAERWRSWESCFSLDHSYLHGGPVRGSSRSRYRQWLTHKFATWHDQFGTSGCVGCGRCITWCPVAIDVTEELTAIRANSVPGEPVS